MKRGTPDHPKCRLLQGYLGGNIQQTVGLLELLFHFTAKYCPCGNIGRFSNQEIARGIHWPPQRNADKLIDALVISGWLDKCSENRLVVHDWGDHADGSVRKYIIRNNLTFCVACPENVQTCPENVQTCPPLAHARKPEPLPLLPPSFLPTVEKEGGNIPSRISKPKREKPEPSELAKHLAGIWYDRCLQWEDENAKRETREHYLKKAAPLWDKEIKINPATDEKTVTAALDYIERHHGTNGFSWKGKVFSPTKLLVGDGAKWPTILNQLRNGNGNGKQKECFRDRGVMKGTSEQEAAESRLIAQVLGGAPDEEEGFGWPDE